MSEESRNSRADFNILGPLLSGRAEIFELGSMVVRAGDNLHTFAAGPFIVIDRDTPRLVNLRDGSVRTTVPIDRYIGLDVTITVNGFMAP